MSLSPLSKPSSSPTECTLPVPWVVLVVDDEPEVHQVTELVLGDTQFQGRPLELLFASSAGEARHLLTLREDTALVLLDVVMESDDAGLALTGFIRDELGDEDIQIILRTGQPGCAPEQEVILNFDINGYVLKSESTAQKLRSVVIGALRNYGYLKKLRTSLNREPDAVAVEGRDRNLAASVHSTTPHGTNRSHPVLSAAPLVRLHDHAWSALQLTVNHSVNDNASHRVVYCDSVGDGRFEAGTASLQHPSGVDINTTPTRTDAWLLRQACELAAQVQRRHPDPVDIIVPVESSGRQLANVPGVLSTWLNELAVKPDRLVLELSESALVLDRNTAGRFVANFKDIGVRIALVHSAVSIVPVRWLRDIRPSMLKIPSELVGDLSNNGANATMVRAIIALAHTLEMTVVAEGVSCRADLEFLRWEGCDLAQGDLVSSSLPDTDALRLFGRPVDKTSAH